MILVNFAQLWKYKDVCWGHSQQLSRPSPDQAEWSVPRGGGAHQPAGLWPWIHGREISQVVGPWWDLFKGSWGACPYLLQLQERVLRYIQHPASFTLASSCIMMFDGHFFRFQWLDIHKMPCFMAWNCGAFAGGWDQCGSTPSRHGDKWRGWSRG